VITPSLRPRRAARTLLGSLAVILLLAFSSQAGLFAASNSPQPSAQKSQDKDKPYALIAGTVWGPDDRPVYGVTVRIRLGSDKPKKVRWEVYSDHHGEFAQRVPAGEADYILFIDPKGLKTSDGKRLRLLHEVTVHIYNEEREDTGLHLTY